MKTTGNGTSQTCVDNLLALRRGEIALDGLRGLPPEIIDRAESRAMPALKNVVRETLETYEPRIIAGEVELPWPAP